MQACKTVLLFLVLLLSSFRLAELEEELDQIIGESKVHVGIEVVSLKDFRTIYQKNAHQFFNPASCQKLYTAGAALELLGGHFCFETKLFLDEAGNVYIKGSGDPAFTSNHIADLALQLRLKDVTAVTGNLFIDASDFDSIAQGPGWMWDEPPEFWNAPLDVLNINHNCMQLWVAPGKSVGSPVLSQLLPITNYVSLKNYAKTAEKETKLAIEKSSLTREERINATGQMALSSCPKCYQVALSDPKIFAAGLFAEELERQQITFSGKLAVKETPPNAKLVATHSSVPLSQLLFPLLKDSDNLYANALFKKIGQAQRGSPGSWQKGSLAVKQFLRQQVGLSEEELVLLDGDGQSRYNLTSPHQLVNFLVWMQERFQSGSEFIAALPTSGVDGSLQKRMASPQLKGRVRAKTGTMRGVSSLAGYVLTQDREWLAFAILINGFVRPPMDYKNVIEDRICEKLVQFTR